MHAIVALEIILVSIDKLLSYSRPMKMSKSVDDVCLHFGGYMPNPGQVLWPVLFPFRPMGPIL